MNSATGHGIIVHTRLSFMLNLLLSFVSIEDIHAPLTHPTFRNGDPIPDHPL